MRRIALLVTLVVASAFFLGAAGAPVASAANCVSNVGPSYFPNGDYAFPHNLTSCTDVNGVEFKNVACCNTQTTGWQNFSENIRYQAPTPQNPLVYGLYYAASSYSFTWYRHRICNTTNVVKVVAVYSTFRIHNAVTGTWGTWYVSAGPFHDIWCYA